jgi:hypothetical protein
VLERELLDPPFNPSSLVLEEATAEGESPPTDATGELLTFPADRRTKLLDPPMCEGELPAGVLLSLSEFPSLPAEALPLAEDAAPDGESPATGALSSPVDLRTKLLDPPTVDAGLNVDPGDFALLVVFESFSWMGLKFDTELLSDPSEPLVCPLNGRLYVRVQRHTTNKNA